MTDFLTSWGTALTAFFTLLTALCTWWMAYTSWKAFNQQRRPYIGFDDIALSPIVDTSTSPPSGIFKIGVKLKNFGNTPARYKVNSIHVTINGHTVDEPTFDNEGGTVYPGHSTIYWFPVIQNVPVEDGGLSGIIKYDLSYWGETKERYSSQRELKYALLLFGDKFTTNYTFINEHDDV